MALTSYFNWESALQADLNLEASIFHEAAPEEEVLVAPDYNCHLLPYYYNSHENYSFLDPNTFHVDPSSTTSNFLYPHDVLPHDPLIYENHYNSLLPCPKRQKCFPYDQSLMDLITPTNNFFDGNVIVPNIPEFYDKFPELNAEGGCCGGSVFVDNGRKKNEKTVSAQSMAARERRRKITEKTQELGRLVPGGSKMNTAEMLHAAAKYVTYLKAQLGMLQLMNTLQEDKVLTPTEDMQKLLTSPVVEEKMYLEEKCFVPKEFFTTLTNNKDIQSRPSILKDLNQLIRTDIEIKEQQL